MPTKRKPSPRRAPIRKSPPKPIEKTAEPIVEMDPLPIGEVATLNYYLRLSLQSLLRDLRYNSLAPETVEALALESLETVNLSMSISVLLRIWTNISRGLEMTTDDQLNLMRIALGEMVVVDHCVYHIG